MRPDPFIARLIEAKAQHAVSAMERPGEGLFAYGRAVGIFAGLNLALQLYEELLADGEERGKRL